MKATKPFLSGTGIIKDTVSHKNKVWVCVGSLLYHEMTPDTQKMIVEPGTASLMCKNVIFLRVDNSNISKLLVSNQKCIVCLVLVLYPID